MKKLLVAILLIFVVSSVFADEQHGHAYGDITAYTINISSFEVFYFDLLGPVSVADGPIDHSVDPNASYFSTEICTGTYDFVCIFYDDQYEVIARDLVEDVFVPSHNGTVRVDFNQ